MTFSWTRKRRDWAAAAALGLAVAVSWGLVYDVFGAQKLADPISYRGDAYLTGAAVSAARRGEYLPFVTKLIPSLGAPFVASWNDWPITEDLLVFVSGLLARVVGTFGALNLVFVAACVSSALSAFFVGRRLGLRRPGAALAGFLFGLSNFIFMRGVHHFSLTFYWVVPWNVLVASWLASRGGVPGTSRRMSVALVTTLLTGWGFFYYSFFATQLLTLGVLAGVLRHGWRRRALPYLGLGATLAIAALSMNVDTLSFVRANGANPAAIYRNANDVELYALKPINLLVGGDHHRFEWMRGLARRAAEQSIISGEHPDAYMGVAASACLLGLGVYFVWAVGRRRADARVGWAAMATWLLVAHAVGGLNSVMGLGGMRVFRSVNRVSIIVVFFALLFGGWLAGRLLRRVPWPAARWVAVALVGALGAYEQIPMRPEVDAAATLHALAESDRKLVAQAEAALPAGAMVFEIPVMHFPEVPAAGGVDSYELFRPTFYAHTLRFSHGDVKGRPNADWKFRVASLPLPQMVGELKAAGFSAVYINRKGVPDRAQGLVAALLAGGGRLIADAEAGDSVVVGL